MHFSDWFGKDNIETIRTEANKQHGSLETILKSIVHQVDVVLDNNAAFERVTADNFMEEGLIKCQSDVLLIRHFDRASPEKLKRALTILERMYTGAKQFAKKARDFEQVFKDQVYNKKLDTVKQALADLANPLKQSNAAAIETEISKVQNSIIKPLSDGSNNNKNDHEQQLYDSIKEAYEEYQASERKGRDDLYALK